MLLKNRVRLLYLSMHIENKESSVIYIFCELVITPEDLENVDMAKIRRFCAWKRFTKVHIPEKLKEVFYSSGVHDAISPCTHRGAILYSEYCFYKKTPAE